MSREAPAFRPGRFTVSDLTGLLEPGAAMNTVRYVQGKPIYTAYVRRALSLCGDVKGKDVLDVGCGTGGIGLELAFMGARSVTFQDIDWAQLFYASRQAEQYGLRARYHLGPIEPGVYRGAFDVIVAAEVLEHLPDDWVAVQVLRDALRPGGTLVATAPHVSTMEKGDHDHALKNPRPLLSPPGEVWGVHDHCREYSEQDFSDLLSNVGPVDSVSTVDGDDYNGIRHVSVVGRARKGP